VRLACLLHDVGYCQDPNKHVEASVKVAQKFLEDIGFNGDKIKKVVKIIGEHGGSAGTQRFTYIESKILWTADKMDFVGPYGLVRSLIKKSDMKSIKEILQWYVNTAKKFEIEKIDDIELRKELKKNWEITKRFLKVLR